MSKRDSVVSKVFVQKNTNGADGGFKRLVGNMQSNGLSLYKESDDEGGLIGEKDVVLIKINGQWDERGGTNTDLLKSIIESIAEHPNEFAGEIIVADNGQAQFGAKGSGGSFSWENNNALDKSQSVQYVIDYFESKGFKISAILWDEFTENKVGEYEDGDYEDGFIVENEHRSTGLQVTYAKFRTKYGTMVSFKKGIWDDKNKMYDSLSLKVISVPVLKVHKIYQVTAAIKNYMGTTSDKLTKKEAGDRAGDAHKSVGKGGMGTQMANTRVPVLNILDAIWINPNLGPKTLYTDAVETDIIAASTDPVALDYWASKNILMEEAKKIGNDKYETLSPDGREPGTFGHWLRLAMEELQKSGAKVTMDEEKIDVYIA